MSQTEYEKLLEAMQAIKSLDHTTPYGLVFNEKNFRTLESQAREKIKTPEVLQLNTLFGIGVYIGDKVPEGEVRVAYSQKEVEEILEHGYILNELREAD